MSKLLYQKLLGTLKIVTEKKISWYKIFQDILESCDNGQDFDFFLTHIHTYTRGGGISSNWDNRRVHAQVLRKRKLDLL